jgi:serine/threonine protein kinase
LCRGKDTEYNRPLRVQSWYPIMSSLIGKLLQGGKYKLESVLGRGGFGLTFRAHQIYLDQVVVIKTLHESFWSAPNLSDLQRQFQDEARRLALCSHPNVVRVSDFFIEDNLPYMVMDYIPGRSLADIVLPSNPLPVKASIDYVSQIGLALQAVHSKGLLHRDVKPQNIMIHQLTGEAVLIDFGIARELTPNPTQTHTSIVSEGYAPIEQYLPKAQRSAATDIYGLAATLYTLLTAEVPVAAVLRDRVPLVPIQQLRPDVNNAMADAIAQGMNIELKDRPQSVGRWISLLTARQNATRQNTARQNAIRQSRTQQRESRLPTQVASPDYYRSVQPEGGSKTVAMPIPTGYGEETLYPPANRQPRRPPIREQAKARGKGFGCSTFFMLMFLALAGGVAGISFWLYQQAGSTLALRMTSGLSRVAEIGFWLYRQAGGIPDESAPALPEIKRPIPAESEPTPPEPTPSVEEKAPEPATAPAVEEPETPPANEEVPPDDKPSLDELLRTIPKKEKPPILREDGGNPEDAQSGDTGALKPVPGTREEDIEEQLGAPT